MEITLTVGMVAIGLAFVLAYVTWRTIETPARRYHAQSFRQALLRLYAVPSALFMSVGLFSYVTEGAPQRFSDEMRELISSYSFERDLTRSCSVRAED